MNDLDSILDSTLDDLADLPEFKPFPAGAHKVTFTYEEKVVNKKAAIELKFKALETLELSDPTKDQPAIPGQESNVLLMFKNNDGTPNEFSQGILKNFLSGLKEKYQGATNREVLAAAKGAELVIITGVRENKNAPGTFNMTLKETHCV